VVERGFDFVENNFLPGRTFVGWMDINAQAIEWCDKVNGRPLRRQRTTPNELFVREYPSLIALPAFIPEVYALHDRLVDIEGFVAVHTNRYSAPPSLIGKWVEVRETKERIDLFLGPRMVGSHPKVWDPIRHPSRLPEHKRLPGTEKKTPLRSDEELLLLSLPEMLPYLSALKAHSHSKPRVCIRKLHQMLLDYPRQSFVTAIVTATRYRMYDLGRLETMILRNIADDYFVLPDPHSPSHDHDPLSGDDDE